MYESCAKARLFFAGRGGMSALKADMVEVPEDMAWVPRPRYGEGGGKIAEPSRQNPRMAETNIDARTRAPALGHT